MFPAGLDPTVIAVFTYRLVMISIDLSETVKKKCTENFVGKKILDFVSDEFFLGLNLSQTEFCLRLNFVLD